VGLSVGSWATLRTVNYTSIGGRMEIDCQSTVYSSTTDTYVTFRVLVDGSEIDSWPKPFKGGTYERSSVKTDSLAGAGFHTIQLQAQLEPLSGAADSVNHRLQVTEHKTER
jgi:hypothetical protein